MTVAHATQSAVFTNYPKVPLLNSISPSNINKKTLSGSWTLDKSPKLKIKMPLYCLSLTNDNHKPKKARLFHEFFSEFRSYNLVYSKRNYFTPNFKPID